MSRDLSSLSKVKTIRIILEKQLDLGELQDEIECSDPEVSSPSSLSLSEIEDDLEPLDLNHSLRSVLAVVKCMFEDHRWKVDKPLQCLLSLMDKPHSSFLEEVSSLL